MQTYSNIEHIVVDGGSTDGTRDFLETEFRIPLWSSEADRGRYDAMNKGIDKAKGDIIGILNSDDYYFPNALEIVKNYFVYTKCYT